jgi:hypothetical protein
MFKKLSICVTVLCAFAFTGTVFADDQAVTPPPAAAQATPAATPAAPAKHSKTSIISGAVVSVDATAKQIVVKGSEGKMDSITFDVSDDANIRKAGKEIALTDIAAGDRVMVAFKHKDDKRVATSIKVRTPKPAAPAAPATPEAK